ncbi:hypothetical protein D3C73_679100 [compost metagenome]
MLVERMRPRPVRTETVQRRHAERSGKIAVRASARHHALERNPELCGNLGRGIEQLHALCGLRKGRPVHLAGDLECDIRINRLHGLNSGSDLGSGLVVRHAHIDLHPAFRRNCIAARAALDRPHRHGDAALGVIECLKVKDKPRRGPDCAASILGPSAGMRSPSPDGDIVHRDTLAGDDDLAAITRRLDNQRITSACRQPFHIGARRKATDLLVRHEDQIDRHAAAPGDRNLQRFERHQRAGFHIVDAGTIKLVAVPPQRQLLGDHPMRMHGVEMCQYQHTLFIAAFSPRRAHCQNIAKSKRSGQALHIQRSGFRQSSHPIDQPVDGMRIMRRCFDLHPCHEFLQ